MATIAIVFLAWDTPRLLKLPYLWIGLILGLFPVMLWYMAQWLHYGQEFLGTNLLNQSLQRIWTDVEQNSGAPWYYVLEVLKYSVPWLLFLPLGGQLAWKNSNLSWAKLAIVWGTVYLAAISLMATKLPWYGLPLYPALALIGGAELAILWQQGKQVGVKPLPPTPYSRAWIGLFAMLAIAGWLGMVYFGWFSRPRQLDLTLILAFAGLTMTIVALFIARQNAQFITLLIWGMYVSLMLLMLSNHWVWELAEAYPVKPVAAIVQQHTPIGQKVYTSYPYNRPSLNFYSDRQVIPIDQKTLRRVWQQEAHPYVLLDDYVFSTVQLKSKRTIDEADGWRLITKDKR